MKINVIGKFPGQYLNGVGVLPQRGIEMTESDVLRLLNFTNIRVFDATSGGLLTKATFASKKKQAPTAVIPKKNVPVESVPAEPVVDTKPTFTPFLVEPETVTEEPKVEEPVAIKETPVEIGVDLAQNEDVVVEETVEAAAPVEEEKSRQNYNNGGYKKNKKNRYNNNRDQKPQTDKE